jgi:hypothetical protein
MRTAMTFWTILGGVRHSVEFVNGQKGWRIGEGETMIATSAGGSSSDHETASQSKDGKSFVIGANF